MSRSPRNEIIKRTYEPLTFCQVIFFVHDFREFITLNAKNLPPRDSSPGGEALVMVSNSAAKSTWHEVSSHDNKPEIKSKYCNRNRMVQKMYNVKEISFYCKNT